MLLVAKRRERRRFDGARHTVSENERDHRVYLEEKIEAEVERIHHPTPWEITWLRPNPTWDGDHVEQM